MIPKLFLLEFHFGTIEFVPTYKDIPRKDNIYIFLEYADVYVEINPKELPPAVTKDEGKKVKYNMGKSYLFMSKPSELIKKFLMGKIDVFFMLKFKTPFGQTSISWLKSFVDMVKMVQQIGVVKPVDYANTVDITNDKDELVGTIDFYLRLSCYGNSTETQYTINQLDTGFEYLLKNPFDKQTMRCQMIEGMITNPVAALYNPVTRPETTIVESSAGGMSWTDVFGKGGKSSKLSSTPNTGVDVSGTIPLNLMQNTSMETISIVFRPEENKFFDLAMINTEVVTTDKGTVFFWFMEKDGDKERRRSLRKKTEAADVEPEDPLELTADRINRKLCQNKDCPAVKKFKAYGLGPLASTGKGLGTIYGDIESHVSYGISQTYGTMDRYGPYGVFYKPKDPSSRECTSDECNCKTSGESVKVITV